MSDRQDLVEIDYTNHRGMRAKRRVTPGCLWFGVSPYHEGEQWFLRAWDLGKDEGRDFAMKHVHGWREAP